MKKHMLVLVASVLLSAPAGSQVSVPMTPGQAAQAQLADAIAELVGAIGDLSTASREVATEMAEARRQYWDAGESDRVARAKRFENALRRKDLHFVVVRLWQSPGGQNAFMKLARNASGMERVDDAISPYCYHTFTVWADALINAIGPNTPLEKALQRTEAQYAAYRTERDVAERLFFDPRGVLRSERPASEEYLTAWLLGTKYSATPAAAGAAAKMIRGRAGEGQFARIVELLQSWSTVTRAIEGPWGVSPQALIDAVLADKPSEPTGEWAANGLRFLELRGRIAVRPINGAAALDSIQALWESARSSRDWNTLRRAVAARDALLARVGTTITNNLQLYNDDGKTTISMLELNLRFMDQSLQSLDLALATRGQPNPRAALAAHTTREYLAVSGKFGERRPASMPASALVIIPPAPSAGSATAVGLVPAPTVAEAGDEPFNHALLLSQDPLSVYIQQNHLSQSVSNLAKQWKNGMMSKRRYGLDRAITGAQELSARLKQELARRQLRIDGTPNSEARTQLEARYKALRSVMEELDARIPAMQRVASSIPQE